jgi:hypothetical protein
MQRGLCDPRRQLAAWLVVALLGLQTGCSAGTSPGPVAEGTVSASATPLPAASGNPGIPPTAPLVGPVQDPTVRFFGMSGKATYADGSLKFRGPRGRQTFKLSPECKVYKMEAFDAKALTPEAQVTLVTGPDNSVEMFIWEDPSLPAELLTAKSARTMIRGKFVSWGKDSVTVKTTEGTPQEVKTTAETEYRRAVPSTLAEFTRPGPVALGMERPKAGQEPVVRVLRWFPQ